MKNRIIKVFLLLISIGLIVFLGQSVIQTRALEKERTEYLDALKAEALPYEQEMAQIRQEIADYGKEKDDEEVIIIPPRGRVMVGYQLNTAGYLYHIRSQSEQYGFSPVIVLDCSEDLWVNQSIIISMLPTDYFEVVFTASSFNESTMENVAKVREAMRGTSLIDTNTFLLRGVFDTEENQALLLENGFDKCFRLNNNVANEVTEEGLALMGYCDMNSRSATSIKNSLEVSAENAISVMYIFDMKSWPLSYANEKTMDSYLDAISSYAGDGSLIPSTVSESFANLFLERVQKHQDKDDFMEEKEARLAELEAITQEIYSRWDSVKVDEVSYLPWLRFLR